MNRNTFVPTGMTKIKIPKKIWRPIPQMITRQLTTFLLEEQTQAKAAMTKIPKKLIRL